MKTTNAVQAAADNEEIKDGMYDMTIDEKSSVFLMDALGKLYSQPARAALREYLANAVDAHVEKGGSLPPIQVRLPHRDNKRVLSIRDFGKGMDEEGFKNILRRYGASTKRNSNKLTGGFGLGAKSGFAVADQFFMTSYQNGQRLKVRVFKNAGGKGFLEIVERGRTSEADGMLVEVEVPSGNLNEVSYTELVNDNFFSAYHASELEVIGYEERRNSWGGYSGAAEEKVLPLAESSLHNPEIWEPLEYGGTVVGWMSRKANSGRNTPVRAVIGRVAYVIKHDQSSGSYSYSYASAYSEKFGEAMNDLTKFNRDIVLNIPIGSVDLPSSREEITYSDRSVKTISAIGVSVHRMVEEGVQRIVNAQPTAYEAIKELHSLISGGFWKDATKLTWRGQHAPIMDNGTQFSEKSKALRFQKTDATRNSLNVTVVTENYVSSVAEWNGSKFSETVTIHAADAEEFALASKKVKSYITDFHKATDATKVQVFLFPPADKLAQWFEQGEQMTLDEFLEVGKKYRARQRAEAKKLAEARRGNAAFATRKSPTDREVFWFALNEATENNHGYRLDPTNESELLTKAKNFYYLSRAEVKDVSAELSNLFPTRRGDGSGSIEDVYSRVLGNLKDVLGDDAKVVFVPATRNLDDFKATYPNVPSILTALRDKLKAEWDTVKQGSRTNTFLHDLFWMASNRNRVVLVWQFVRNLTAGEKVSLNSDILTLMDYMEPEKRKSHSRMNILAAELLGKPFTTEVTGWMEQKVNAVGDRYPLLTMMNPVGHQWDELKPEMLRYLKTC